MKNKAFYRYIYKQGDKYSIQKDGQYYGGYDKLEDALFDRDRLIQTDWNVELWLELPEIPNPYYNMDLTPFNHDRTYISIVPMRYRVQKSINGKLVNFGDYKYYEDAKKRRDELISNNWRE